VLVGEEVSNGFDDDEGFGDLGLRTARLAAKLEDGDLAGRVDVRGVPADAQ
jgi:hypothetical protein